MEVPVSVPSQQPVVLLDVITNVPGVGLTYRFRYLAPHIGAGAEYDRDVADMQHLCDSHALKRLSGIGPVPNQIVITLADRPVAFGEMSPEAVQFFEAYRPGEGICIWEGF
ncbi:DUF6497 family protein [Oceaniglobus trochenteri]|uniref:DUF6497 family protein n=1 Tax=Oceaniglobus trochenteri TaxID=2763260 RepID=UPI003CC9EDB2